MKNKKILMLLILSGYLNAELLIENFGNIKEEHSEVIKKPMIKDVPSINTGESALDRMERKEKERTLRLTPEIKKEGKTVDEKVEEYEEFDLPDVEKSSKNVKYDEDDDGMIGKSFKKNLNKIEKKQYSKVRYNLNMNKYAMIDPGKNGKKIFKDYLEENEIDEFLFKRYKDSDSSIESLLVSALYYDWFLSRPDFAENFYKRMFKRKKELSLKSKYYLSDYLIRTDRGHLIHKVIEKKECSIIFKGRDDCFYYLGLDKYLNNGDRSNNYLRIAKSKNELAKKLFRNKK